SSGRATRREISSLSLYLPLMNMSISIGTSVRGWPPPNELPVSTRCCKNSEGSSEILVPAGQTPTTTAVPPRCVASTACSIVACVPTSSNAKSAPPVPLIACTRATGSSVAALTTCVAPVGAPAPLRPRGLRGHRGAGDELAGADELRGLDGVEPPAAAAPHGHARPRRHLGPIEARARSRQHAAGDQAHHVERRVLAD